MIRICRLMKKREHKDSFVISQLHSSRSVNFCSRCLQVLHTLPLLSIQKLQSNTVLKMPDSSVLLRELQEVGVGSIPRDGMSNSKTINESAQRGQG